MDKQQAAKYLGAIGGKARTQKKIAASRSNAAKARAVRLARLAEAARVAGLTGGRA